MHFIKIISVAFISSALLLGCNKDSQLEFETAKKHLKQKNYKQAFKIYYSLASQNNAEAQFYLGLMYHYGRGTKKDKKLSIKWIQVAAEHGNSDAQFTLALWYFIGIEIKQDYKKAFTLMKQAADAGNPGAMEHVASMYSKGQGVKQNEKKAIFYFRKASELKRPLAQYLLAIAEEGPDDYRKRLELLYNSAKNGFDMAQITIGMICLSGVNKNLKSAEGWFNLAIKQGNITPNDIDDARKYVAKLNKKISFDKRYVLIFNFVEKLRHKLHKRRNSRVITR